MHVAFKKVSSAEFRHGAIAGGILLLLLFLLYFPGLDYPFLRDWDDGNFVLYNSRLAFTAENLLYYALNPFHDLYTPLPLYSLMADHALFGLQPLCFRLHNLLLHFAAAGFLLLTLRLLGIRLWIAFAAAFLWAANPQKVESVIWITERKDVLCGALALAAVYFFVRALLRGRTSYAAGVLAALAIFAKPAAAPLPGVMIVATFCLFGRRLPWRRARRLLCFPVAASLAALFWATLITAKTNPGVPETNLAVPLFNLFRYPVTALIPYETNPVYPPLRGYAPAAVMAIAGIVLAAGFLFVGRRTGLEWRRILSLLLIIAGCTVPVLGLLRYTNFHHCDRYNYLVSAAVWGSVAILAERWAGSFRNRDRGLKIAAAAIAYCFFYLTWSYIPYWESCEKLYACSLQQDRLANIKTLENVVYSSFRTNNTALLTEVADRLMQFHREYGVTKEQAANMELFFREHTALVAGNYPAALGFARQLSEILERSGRTGFLWPDLTFPLLYRDLAVAAAMEKRPQQAITLLDLELRARGQDDPQYFVALAMKAQLTGDYAGQIAAWESAVRLEPENRKFRQILSDLKTAPPPSH